MAQTVKVRLANILLARTEQFVRAPTLLCWSDQPVIAASKKPPTNLDQAKTTYESDGQPQEDSDWLLDGPGTFDFTTFFNALSVAKWRRYTVASSFWLHLELRGADCTIASTRGDTFSYQPEIVKGSSVNIGTSDTWQTFDIALPSSPEDVLEAFRVIAKGPVFIRNSYYFTEVEPQQVRPVELALCTTTFKKEAYVTRNINLVRQQILSSSGPIAQHFHMHVIDNGQTLEAEKLSGDGISVHPNQNVGGAGGFARGMIEAMQQTPKATHVLLMDDDVALSPESIVRTYNLLSIVNDEYESAFISGAMMPLNEPTLRFEDVGHVKADGTFGAVKPPERMDYFNNVVNNEDFDIPVSVPGYEDMAQYYGAWWYCVIPMTCIEQNGLPLPIFVRGDDVEYGRRCKPRFMTMNGICVWHEAFDLRYNAAQERYQTVRNCFIGQFTSNIAPLSDFMGNFDRMFQLDLKKFDYKDAELSLRGFEDFLRGPEWIMQPVAQEAFLAANRDREKLLPLEEITEEVLKLGVDLKSVTRWQIRRDLPRDKVAGLFDYLTIGGNRFTQFQVQSGKVAVIEAAGWAYPKGKLHGAETIIAIDMANRQGIIRHQNRDKFQELWNRYREDRHRYEQVKDDLLASYQKARPRMTSVAFWRRYLGI